MKKFIIAIVIGLALTGCTADIAFVKVGSATIGSGTSNSASNNGTGEN